MKTQIVSAVDCATYRNKNKSNVAFKQLTSEELNRLAKIFSEDAPPPNLRETFNEMDKSFGEIVRATKIYRELKGQNPNDLLVKPEEVEDIEQIINYNFFKKAQTKINDEFSNLTEQFKGLFNKQNEEIN